MREIEVIHPLLQGEIQGEGWNSIPPGIKITYEGTLPGVDLCMLYRVTWAPCDACNKTGIVVTSTHSTLCECVLHRLTSI